MTELIGLCATVRRFVGRSRTSTPSWQPFKRFGTSMAGSVKRFGYKLRFLPLLPPLLPAAAFAVPSVPRCDGVHRPRPQFKIDVGCQQMGQSRTQVGIQERSPSERSAQLHRLLRPVNLIVRVKTREPKMPGCELWRIWGERTLIRREWRAPRLTAFPEKPAVLRDSRDLGSRQRMLGQGALAEGEEPGSNLLRAPAKPAGGSRWKFCTSKT
jgi:hypothetical protein